MWRSCLGEPRRGLLPCTKVAGISPFFLAAETIHGRLAERCPICSPNATRLKRLVLLRASFGALEKGKTRPACFEELPRALPSSLNSEGLWRLRSILFLVQASQNSRCLKWWSETLYEAHALHALEAR